MWRSCFLSSPAGKLVSSLAAGLLAGREVPCSKGAKRRDYLYVEDVADATAAVTTSGVTGAVNIGAGIGTPVVHLINAVERAAGHSRALRSALPPDSPTKEGVHRTIEGAR